MPPVNAVTPIRATVHYDDVSRLWKLHASRLEASSLGQERQIVKENFDTFAELLVLLLKLWALSGTTQGDVNLLAPIGDMALVGAAAAAVVTPDLEDLPEYVTTEYVADPRDLPVYDGEADDWGMAPAGP